MMTEALRRVLEWTRCQPQIYRVWAECDVENVASARVLQKVGMEHEGGTPSLDGSSQYQC